jgi:hypothetical protein
MKKFLIGFALLFVFIARGHGEETPWKEYVYKDDGMAFSMPSDPTLSTDTVKTALGPVALHFYLLSNQNDTEAFMVSVNSYPDVVLQTPPAKLLAGARDGQLKRFKATERAEKQLTLAGHPGIEFQFDGGTVHGISRIYLVGTRLYQLFSFSLNGPPMPETDRILASFRLLTP